jgi:hypothetical protein
LLAAHVQLVEEKLMRVQFRLLFGLAAMLGYTAVAAAVPVMPGSPTHEWLFDTYDAGGMSADTGGSSMPLDLYHRPMAVTTSPGYSHMVLVGDGTGTRPDYTASVGWDQLGVAQPSSGAWLEPNSFITLTGQQATPFLYSGNKSAALDGHSGNNTYPARTHAGGVSATVNATTDLLGTAGSISFWYKPIRHDGFGDGYLFTFRDSATSERLYMLEPGTASGPTINSNLTFRNTGGSDQTLALPGFKMNPTGALNGEPSINTTWYQIAITWDSNSVDVYKNGAFFSSTANVFTGFQPDIFEIGGYSNYTSAAPGLYDEFAMWNTTLSADNISWLYANSLTDISVVPEPASAGLLLTGLIGLGLFRRRRAG